ncbi:major facilitator superfamily domain-containing protein 6 isoform X2 [Anabrus simplex]
MRELGISVEETAIMSAVTPVASILVPPLAGMVADRIGNFRILMAIFSALGGAASLLLLIVPVGRVTVPYPDNVHLHLNCGTAQHVAMSQDFPCTFQPQLTKPEGARVDLSFETCGFECPALNMSGTYGYDVRLSGDNDTDIYSFQSEVSQLTAGRVFFPAPGLYNLSCGDADCSQLLQTRLVPGGEGSLQAMSSLNSSTPGNFSCPDTFNQEVTVSVDGGPPLSSCAPRCVFSAPRKQVCSQLSYQKELDSTLTFWAYLSVRVLIGMIGSTAFAMFEGAVIAILREHKADYGLQRIYATIGGMISSPLSGMLIDYASQGKSYTDFRPAFYLYAGLKIASGLLMLTFNLEFKAPAKNVVTDVLTVLKNVELLVLLAIIFILGSAWGYIESFLFWLLQDLGGSRSLMGVTITVGGLAGIPLLALSGPIIDRIGHAQVLFIGFIFYAIRLLGYSLIYNPWLCLIFEAMESVTSSLSFTAAVTYAARLSSSTTDTSIQGMLGGLYFGVGKGAGSLVGGYLMKWIGTRPTYQCFSVMCALVGCAYFAFNMLYLRRRPQVEGNDIVKKKPKNVENDLPKFLETQPINNGCVHKYCSDVCNVNLGYEHTEEKEVDIKDCKEEKSNHTKEDKGTKNIPL